MKMIDRFLDLVNEVEINKKSPNLIHKWKIMHRKYEILNSIKKKNSFTNEDLLNYSWILQYAKEKKIEFWVEGFSVINVKNTYIVSYDNNGYKCSIKGSTNSDFMSIEYSFPVDCGIGVFKKKKQFSTYTSRTKISDQDDIRVLFSIIKESIYWCTEDLINHIIKGE